MAYKFNILDTMHNNTVTVCFNHPDSMIFLDEAMANLLDISIEEYTKIALRYQAIYNEHQELVFTNMHDAYLFADYLNETYLIVLKLRGKI